MSILSQIGQDALDNFLQQIRADYGQTETLREIALRTVKYLRGDKLSREQMQDGQELMNTWYKSLSSGSPDYSVYDTEYYLAELWACWVIYSRKYLLSIQSPKSMGGISILRHIGKPDGVLDLGCGFGYTTAALKELFSVSDVIGTNLDNTTQMRMARMFGDKYNFAMVSDLANIHQSHIDLVFASEYFEHIPMPIAHLHEVLDLSPRCLLIANTFTAKSIGHFDYYRIGNSYYDGRKTSRIFNDQLRRRGYKKMETNLWNSRPAYWVKDGRQ
jgi:SAM-dependent methyltransferase